MSSRTTGTPFVATYHGVYGAGSALKRWYNSIMTRGDLVLVGSRFVAEHVFAEHGVASERLVVVPEGVDTAVWNPEAVGPRPPFRRIGMMGGLFRGEALMREADVTQATRALLTGVAG